MTQLTDEDRALIESVTGRPWITARSMLLGEAGIVQIIAAAREQGALSAARTQSQGEGWEPIETAPRDGTFILACQMPDEPPKSWHKSWEQWKAPMTIAWRAFHPNAPGKECWRDHKGSPVTPTHWRPLPAAPSPGGDHG